MALTMSRENYLKIIYILKKANGEVRSIDIANYMELSKPSVCAAVKQLQAQGYITKDGNGIIELTESGRAEAKEVFERHCFFEEKLIAVGVSHFPKIELKEDEKSGSKDSYLALFKQKYVWLFFLGIFCYVSTEQGTSIFMSTFLEQYHGVNPQAEGAQAVSYFWGLMTAGCLVGMILLKLIDSKRLLQVSGVLTIVLLLAALFGSKDVSLIAFPAIGFSISMMYSIVFSLALNSASQHHGSFAGILCSAIVGGAGGPMIVSTLADATSLRTGMLSILLFVGYITFIGFWAHPLINNKTISLKELLKKLR